MCFNDARKRFFRRQLVPLLTQHPFGPMIRRLVLVAYSSRPNLVVGEGSRCLGVAWQPLLGPRCLLSLSRSGEFFRLLYAPQMLSSLLEVPNPAEDKAVRLVAPTSEVGCSYCSVDFSLCVGAAKDCSHLFFECQFAQTAWRSTPLSGQVTSPADSFWRSISRELF